MQEIGKALIIFGILLIGVGLLLTFFMVQESIPWRAQVKHFPIPLRKSPKVIAEGDFLDKIPYLGKLPGDILIQKKNFTFYFPLATSVLISIILSLVFWLWSRR